ncbi:Clustered mitochondria protein [Hondaea fermentalgiana]|uniref:Clustered mitochondria protein n=1 Tax=Hondaea fermentalgiana TaxID=2315210 RepID=A0A2R5GCV8_9STRA|nr:Clustered mitochondria protein [Hondaea fermentalgiana]|eukprot:GBG28810.1 Clustered mitochondria protein [Hondaea fermentalgiana]
MPEGYVVFAGARAGEACAGTALPAVQEDEGAGVAGPGLAARQGPRERQHDGPGQGQGRGQDQDQGAGRRERRTYAAAATASARGESSATARGATRYTEFFGNAGGGSASSPAVDAVRSGTGKAGRALSCASGSDDDGSETIFTASGEESGPSEGLLQSVSLASSRVSAHPLDLGRFDSGFDWEFQRLMEVVTRDQTVLRESETFQQLTALVQDFRHAAMVYGKVIISEKHLAVERKTIKPVEVGGYAGGEKYVAGNVFFRFPNDMHGFYGGSIESASKEANHQIKGLTALFNASVPGLCLPLLCVIKHRGYKLVAMSVLPIRGQETLCYGSSDGGMNIGCLGENGGSTDAGEGDENAAKLMEGAARALNLAKHPVMARARTSRGARPTPVWLHMPCDMEVHRCNVGNTSRYYAVDFARLFPAQPPTRQLESIIADAYGDEPFAHKVTSSNHLVHRLRPELVRAWHTPLSSDAFSNFSSRTEREDTFDRDAASAVKHMFAVSMNSLIKDLDANRETQEASAVQRAVSRRVVEAFHRNGVNMRFLGVVSARSAGKPDLQRELMLEAVARVVKLLVRGAQRGVCSDVRTAVITPYLSAVREVLNQIFGITTCTRNDAPADSGGGGDCGMSKETGACSCGSFVEPARQSFRDMGHAMRLGRLPSLGSSNSEGDTEGVEDDEELVGRRNFWCKRTLCKSTGHVWNRNDLVEVEGSIHLLPIMQYAEGTELFIRSRSKLGQGKRKEAHRLARLALKRFSAGLSMNPSDVRLLCNRGFLINYFHDTFGEGERGAGNADFLLALRANPQHARSWYYLGKELYSYWINDGYNVKPSIESQVSALRSALPIDDGSLESMESLFAGTKIREERSRALLQYVDYCLKQALRADPGLTNCVKDYANFRYHTLVDLDGAEALYLRALDLDPEHGRTLQNLARLYRKRGDLDKAATTIARNLDVDPENPLIFLELADTVLQSLAKGRQSTFPAHVTFAKAKLPYPSSLGKGSMNLDRKMLKRLQPGLATGFRASAGDIIPVLTRANDLVRDAIALIQRRINDDHLRGHSREVWTGFEWSIRIIEADAFYMEHQSVMGEGSETQTLVKLRRQKSAAHTAYARSLVWSVDDSVHFRLEWNDVELRAVVKTATRKLRESAQTLRMEADLSNEVVYTLELAQKQLLQACELEPRSRSAARMSLASLWLIFHKVEDDELLAAMDEDRSKTPRNDRANKSVSNLNLEFLNLDLGLDGARQTPDHSGRCRGGDPP